MLNIEIKTEAVGDTLENGIEEKVIRLVQENKMQKHVVISSFDYRAVERIKKNAPDILTGLLFNKKRSAGRNPVQLLAEYQADFFHCSKAEMKESWIRQLQEVGKKYLIYTVNRRKSMRNWLQKGAYGIFSDKPDQLKAVAEKYISRDSLKK